MCGGNISSCVGDNIWLFGEQYLGECYVIFMFVGGNIWLCVG